MTDKTDKVDIPDAWTLRVYTRARTKSTRTSGSTERTPDLGGIKMQRVAKISENKNVIFHVYAWYPCVRNVQDVRKVRYWVTWSRWDYPRCSEGHDLDPANTYVRPNGTQVCRKCQADRRRAKRHLVPEKSEVHRSAWLALQALEAWNGEERLSGDMANRLRRARQALNEAFGWPGGAR